MIIKGKNEGLGKRASEQENEPEMTEKWQKRCKVSDYFFSSRMTFIIDTSFEK